MTSSERSELRRSHRRARRELPDDERAVLDEAARVRLLELLGDRPPGVVALSLPTDGEVDVAALAPTLRSSGWTVVLPVVDPHDPDHMRFCRWDDGTPMRPNRFGILEPDGSDPVEPDSITVVVVPAVAVDRSGVRLGFGGGFYDRALERRDAGTLLVAVVHDVQVADSLPVGPHDVGVDVVVTPSTTFRPDDDA